MDIETLIHKSGADLKTLDLYKKVKDDFIGINTCYTNANNKKTRRIYLDSTASTLMMGVALRTATSFLKHYANTHSLMHFGAKISTKTYNWIHRKILSFVGADPDEYTCFFTGSGTTSGMNRLARTFRQYRPDKDIVLVSIMEHHSNDLPHRKHGGKVMHIPVDTHKSTMGSIDMNLLEKYLEEFSGRVNYVSVTGISNVTGIINPINEVAELAHKYGAYIIVDAAQMAAHVPICMTDFDNPNRSIDALVFSGHKTYAPGSPGVVITRKSFLSSVEPDEVGGGMVDRVFPDNYYITKQYPDREEAGTPNILGSIILGSAIHVLDTIGMDQVLKKDIEITNFCLDKMLLIKDVVVYGEQCTKKCPRAGTLSFNIRDMDHGIVAAILNDYYNIAVRNECFCAHPYVEEMLKLTHSPNIIEAKKKQDNFPWHTEPWMGMVRVSFGMYNSHKDVITFITALDEICQNKDKYKKLYSLNIDGDYIHKSFKFSSKEYFSLTETVNKDLSQ